MNTADWIGKTLAGRYQIEELMGQGGMSSVFKANATLIEPGLHLQEPAWESSVPHGSPPQTAASVDPPQPNRNRALHIAGGAAVHMLL